MTVTSFESERFSKSPTKQQGQDFRSLISATAERPCAIFWRQVATPNYELRSFLRASRRLGLKPVILTYEQDRISCHNQFKRSLVAPMFIEGVNRLGHPIWRRRQICNVGTVEGFRFSDASIGETTLSRFHHNILRLALPEATFDLIDASEFCSNFQNDPRQYYVPIFSGMTEGTVLFETFLTDKEEGRFFESVVRPAFVEATEILGHEPSIISLCSGRRAASPLWYAYPDSYRAHFAALGVTL